MRYLRLAGLCVVLALVSLTIGVAPAGATPVTVVSWGDNEEGQLGDGMIGGQSNVPVSTCDEAATGACSVANANVLTGSLAISENVFDTLALQPGGKILAWGRNEAGQVGNGTSGTPVDKPTHVLCPGSTEPCSGGTDLENVTAISSGGTHNLALLSNGTVAAWGSNAEDQLGDGTPGNSLVPVTVCAPAPTPISPPCSKAKGDALTGVIAISASAHHSLALLNTGHVVAWGANPNGELGNGTTTNSDVPVAVCEPEPWTGACPPGSHELSGVKEIAAGYHESLALLNGGEIMAWGDGGSGELGDATAADHQTPVWVCKVGYTPDGTQCPRSEALLGVKAISAGGGHSIALLQTGTVVEFGEKPKRTFTFGVDIPIYEAGLSNVEAISAGQYHDLALLTNHTVMAWAYGLYGQLGDNSTLTSESPVAVCEVEWAPGPCPGNELHGVTAISAGGAGSVALGPIEGGQGPPPPSPYWYSEGKLLGQGILEEVKTKGTITLHLGEATITCKVKDLETIENPLGGGAGVDHMVQFILSGCKGTPSPCAKGEKLEVSPAGLPWPTQLLAGTPIRDQISGIEIKIECNNKRTNKKSVYDVLTGTLAPSVGNSVLEFDAGSGALSQSRGGTAPVSGTDVLKGPAKDKKITAK